MSPALPQGRSRIPLSARAVASRTTGVVATTAVLTAGTATAAHAHGVQGRAETPVPLEMFFAAAAIVVVVSFVALKVAWSAPRWASVPWWPAPAALGRVVLSPVLIAVLRVVTLAALVFITCAAAFGSTTLNRNIAPVTIFVVWWVGLVPLTLLAGNVWREVNPWATLARVVRARPDTDRYPPRWGMWPAAVLMAVWAWLELVYPTAASPRLLAALIIGYTVLTVAAMARYGVDVWLDHGEVFSVFTRLLATISAIEVRHTDNGRELGFRPPVIAATRLHPGAGLVPFVAVLIGAVTFDGLSGTGVWAARDVAATERVLSLGLAPFAAGIVVASIGLLVMIALAAAAFEAASWAADRAAGLSAKVPVGRVAEAFVHSLIPIAVGYHIAHYFTLYVFQSQDLIRLASDPFGTGADAFGTARSGINFTLVSPNAIWAVQLTAIVGAHVIGLALAHNRALQLAPHSRHAVRSQYPMLALMVLLTVSGLWFLSEGMSTAT